MAQEAGGKRAIISTVLVTIKCARRRGIGIGLDHAPLVDNGNLRANSRRIMIEQTTARTTTGNAVQPVNEEGAQTHIGTATVVHQARNG